MLAEISKHLDDNRTPSELISLITTYCWVGLALDLKEARASIHNLLTDDLLMSAKVISQSEDQELTRKLLALCRTVNSSINEAFSKVESWLHQPRNLNPTASLSELFEATIFEAQDTYPDFNPTIEKRGNTNLDIFGHRYHYFYDAIEPMIVNAAAHGPRDGNIVFEVAGCVEDGLQKISMKVIVELDNQSNLDSVRQNLERAKTLDIGTPMVEEGFSGIRKIRSLVRDVPEITFYDGYVQGKTVVSIVKAEVPHG